MLPAGETYSLLFFDSLFASLLFPFDSELLFIVLLTFGDYPVLQIIIYGLMASVLGSIVNFTIGNMIYKSRSNVEMRAEDERRIQVAAQFFRKYGVWLLLLSGNSMFGSAITLFAGIFNTRILIFLCLTIVGRIGSYMLVLYDYSLL